MICISIPYMTYQSKWVLYFSCVGNDERIVNNCKKGVSSVKDKDTEYLVFLYSLAKQIREYTF